MVPRFLLFLLAAFTFLASIGDANAFSDATCIKSFLKEKAQQHAAGIAPDRVEKLIKSIAADLGLVSDQGIVIVPCDNMDTAHAYVPPPDTPNVPYGEYIIYSPQWVKNVIGEDPTQAVAIFGHELGHLVGRHMTTRHLSLRAQETEADGFAGCAVAHQQQSWEKLKDLLMRIRDPGPSSEDTYPNQTESIAAAEEQFKFCGGKFGENSTATSQSFPKYVGPPLKASISDLDSDWPSGKWTKMGDGTPAFSYRTKLFEQPVYLFFVANADKTDVRQTQIEFSRHYIYKLKDGKLIKKADDREQTEKLCSSKFLDTLVSAVSADFGPVLDRPVETIISQKDNKISRVMLGEVCSDFSNCPRNAVSENTVVHFKGSRASINSYSDYYVATDKNESSTRNMQEDWQCRISIVVPR